MSRRRSTRLESVLNLAEPTRVDSRSWYTLTDLRASSGETTSDLYIYDEIGGWGVCATDLIRDLMSLTSDNIRIRINSPGGDVFEGLAIYNALSIHPANVSTYVEGVAASAASFIALAGDTRTFAKYATGMVHNPSSGMWGESKDLRKMADLLDKIADTLARLYAERAPAGGDAAAWLATMSEETWFNADEAVEFGLATHIDDSVAEKAKNSWDLGRIYNYSGREEAPAPRRRRVMNVTPPVPPAPVEPPVPPVPAPAPATPVPSSQEAAEAPEQEPADIGPTFSFDGEAFRVAMRIAADPAVPTDQAPFEWDPDVFRAIMNDKTLTAPAVVSKTAGSTEPAEFKDQYDPDLFRQAVIEGVSK
jgi:ATP-dependent protease ClpP protease subunit